MAQSSTSHEKTVTTMTDEQEFSLDAVQTAIRDAGFDGWLFYDFRGSDLIARRILGLTRGGLATRRWFYYVPARGEPVRLVHGIEPRMLDSLPGRSISYVSWNSLHDGLHEVLRDAERVAMQYSAKNAVPYVAKVDAGTVELVESCGVEVVSSADLVQLFDATLSPGQLASHRRAAAILRSLIDEVFDRVRQKIKQGESITERELQSFLMGRLDDHGLVYDHGAIVGVDAHAADPHFSVPEEGSAAIEAGKLLLVDVWGKEKAPGSVYADITWTAFVGSEVPVEVNGVFHVVRDARKAVVAKAREAFRSGTPIPGYELDRAARETIETAGYGEYFIHRTGHSIHEEIHGNGANLDDLETHDTRRILPHTLFSVEPGIYLPGRFGIRSEIDVYHTGDDAEVTGPPHQEELEALLA